MNSATNIRLFSSFLKAQEMIQCTTTAAFSVSQNVTFRLVGFDKEGRIMLACKSHGCTFLIFSIVILLV